MRSSLRRGGAAALIAAGAVAIATLPAGSASGVARGSAAPGDGYGFVADVKVGNAVRGCSGALVDPEWIVTARDCFVEGSAPVPTGPPSQPTTVTVGREDLTAIGRGQVRGATHVVPHPSRNLALVKLAGPVVEVTPVKVSATAPAAGEVLQVAGFGRTATEWLPERLHTAPFSVKRVNPGAVEIGGDPSAPASICKGDAGGPTVRNVATGPELVALHSTSYQAGCLGTAASETRDLAIETRVDNVRDWVRQTVRGGTFVRLPTSAQVLDTRSGLGAPAGPRPADSLTPFQVTGVGGIPAGGVTAVLVDVTAITTASTYLTLMPEGAPRPPLSMLNARGNQVISNTAVVPVPASGKIAVYSHGPGAHVSVDVQGYYTTSGTGRGFVPVNHTRIADTRSDLGGAPGVVPPWGSRTFKLTGGVIPAEASAAHLDLIVTGATQQGWVGAYPAGGVNNRSVMDFVGGTTAHSVTVQLGTDGRVTFTNNSNSQVHFVLTALGYYTASADSGAGMRTIPAARRLDTRTVGTGVPVPANSTIDVPLGVPAGTTAVLNLTAVDNTANGHLNVWPLDGTESTTSLVNYAPPGQGPRAGNTLVKVGTGGKVRIRNASSGSAHVMVDLQGWYAPDLVPAGGTAMAQTVPEPDDVNVPGPTVEDFRYPGAESIDDIELIRGDGRITLVECTTDPQLITVESVGRSKFCFRVKGDTGWLSLRLDAVFLVGAGDQVVEATITANGEEETVVVPEGQVRPTGATDPNFAVLLELRASP
ncbi:S1 family peptidase [Nonomuraea sp. NPDC048826]|uniref:S1 family peptidase n=1 Tax=Nonomuraea sp. NPDC048826 TaxID=3364347 RepID=UPI00371BB50A